MSWTGQSLATHSINMAPTKQPMFEPGDRRLAGRHRLGADHADHVDVRAGEETDEDPDFRMELEPPGVRSGELGEHLGVLCRAQLVQKWNVASTAEYSTTAASESEVEQEAEQAAVESQMHEEAGDDPELDEHQHEEHRHQPRPVGPDLGRQDLQCRQHGEDDCDPDVLPVARLLVTVLGSVSVVVVDVLGEVGVGVGVGHGVVAVHVRRGPGRRG